MKPVSCNQCNGEHRKAFVPRYPTESCSVSGPDSHNEHTERVGLFIISWLVVKNLPASVRDRGDAGLIPGSGRYTGEGNGNPLQSSCLGSSMDRGAWWVTVLGVAESQTGLSN